MTLKWWALLIGVAGAIQLSLVVVLAVWEKRLIWPYAPPNEELQPTPNMSRMVDEARSLGCERLGVFRDGKGPMYRIRYEFWVSTQRDTLALLGGGRIGPLMVDGCWLFTRLADGRYLVTLNDQRASEYDLSGLREEALLPQASLVPLLAYHRRRASSPGRLSLSYSDSDPLADHRDCLSRKVEATVQRGYAYFSDRSAGVWHYTIRGAILLSLGGHWRKFRRNLRPDATGHAGEWQV